MLFTPSETKVVIVGGGTMGADVAAVCARGGCAVQVLEPTTERRALLPDYFANTMIELGYEHRLHLLLFADSQYQKLEHKLHLFRHLDPPKKFHQPTFATDMRMKLECWTKFH